MKRYIKSAELSYPNKYQQLLDNLVDGNKIWDPLEGEYKTVSEEQIAEWRNPKPELISELTPSGYYIYLNGKLGWKSVSGEHTDDTRPYRIAGRYKIYLLSFKDAQLPQSRMLIADTETGTVYERTVIHNTGDFRRDISELVEWLKAGNTLE